MLTRAEIESLSQKIFTLRDEAGFSSVAVEFFRLHFEHNPVYGKFVRALYPDLEPERVQAWREIPFLPIEFFKTQRVFLEGLEPETEFHSSGTASQGAVTSTHYVGSLTLYERCFTEAFRQAWGEPSDYVFLALLPSYLQQTHSSLVCMMRRLIEMSGHTESGFYLHDLDALAARLRELEAHKQKTILFGVSYALLDLAEVCPMPLNYTLVFETGGMKGRRKEMTKDALHSLLRQAFGVSAVYSEYGMCELMSQAYSFGDGMRFRCPPWMKVTVRQTRNPLRAETSGRSGVINVIDLGNLYSCPFIATQDLGKIYSDESFEILGRVDNADIRGCNLMVE